MRIIVFIVLGLLTAGLPATGQAPALQPFAVSVIGRPLPDPQDLSIFEQKTALARQYPDLAAQTLAIARSFMGTPYVGGVLDKGETEQLVVNLRELDCWTFMEYSLALALTAQTSQPTFDTLQEHIRQLRYWGGTINGYASRMHYFSGWLLQAEKAGYLQDITRELGGIPYKETIGYMSAHPERYPRLKNPQTLQLIRRVEKRLNQHSWYYIPQDQIAQVESRIQDGDFIALTSGRHGLDIAHQGIAVWQNGRLHLLHASSLGKRVLISAQPLATYIRTQKGQTGIMVARIRQ
ncbi:MAG: DUF1460 domain-containing protein [Bacteroidetes bacterium]|nr:MAG: DUF1460 domain-containing protein [Bacteroidota bacterium]